MTRIPVYQYLVLRVRCTIVPPGYRLSPFGGRMVRFSKYFVLMLALSSAARVQAQSPPVIDVHVHSTNTTPQQELERMKQLNIRYLVVSTLVGDLPTWASALKPNQFVPGLVLPCDHGHGPYTGGRCFNTETEFP